MKERYQRAKEAPAAAARREGVCKTPKPKVQKVNMHSHRFKVNIHITRHARERMATRNISENELLELVEQGTVKYKDATRFWIARYFENRQDNLLSIAAVLEEKIVVKTVMHHFEWEDK